jgi:uncharacterized repeat protein (TIGR01451 family)
MEERSLLSADLAITKSDSSETVLAGEELFYEISVLNSGPDTATDVVVTDTLPAGVVYLGSTNASGCVQAGSTISCDLGNMPDGAFVQFTIKTGVPADFIAANDLNVNEVETVALSGGVSADTFTMTFQDQTTGAIAQSATGLDVQAALEGLSNVNPGDVSVTGVPGGPYTVTFLGALGAKNVPQMIGTGTGTLLALVTTTTQGNDGSDGSFTITNTATVSSSNASADSNPADNTAVELTLVEEAADLRIIKFSTPDDVVRAGEEFSYTIYVENLGPSYARAVRFSDLTTITQGSDPASTGTFQVTDVDDDQARLDSCVITPGFGTQTVSSSINCLLGAPLEPLANNGNSPPGSNGVWTIIVRMQAGAAVDIDNTARVFTQDHATPPQSSTPDPNASNNVASDTISVQAAWPDLVLTKWASADELLPGDAVQYGVRLENLGTSAAANVIVTDTLPPGVQFKSDTANCTLTGSNPDVVTCSLGTLESGQLVEFDTFAEVSVATPPGVELCNTAIATTNSLDFDVSNNTDTSCIVTIAGADLSVTKSGPATIKPGTNITYTITVSNSGPTAAINVMLEDSMPIGQRPLSITPSAGNCLAGVAGDPAQPTTCNLGTLSSASSATVTIVAEADNCLRDQDTLLNDIGVLSDTFDPDPSNNAFQSTTEVGQGSNGNVKVRAFATILMITGNNFGNTIQIEPVPAAGVGAFRIVPLEGTKINGQCRPIQVEEIQLGTTIKMGKANDTIRFAGPLRLPGNLSITGGLGDDTIELDNVEVLGVTTIRMDGGNDLGTIGGSVFRALNIRTGPGDDRLDINDTAVRGAASIRNDGNRGWLRIFDSVFDRPVTLRGGNGLDSLDIGALSSPNANGNQFNAALSFSRFEDVIS